jgi:hypothetical protein
MNINVVKHCGGSGSPDTHRRARTVHVAYFAPYRYDTQHADLMARSALSPLVTRSTTGKSVQGRDVDLLTITDPAHHSLTAEGKQKRVVWIVCRQHPAETMAEWWADGFLDRLLASSNGDDCSGDLERDVLLRGALINIVCCANPDGATLGLTRTNAAGMNLNREWSAPSEGQTPEIFGIMAKISASSCCDLVLDVHGDETLPRPVLCCAPAWNKRLDRLQRAFWDELATANEDFSLEDSLPHLIHLPPAPESCSKTGADRLDNMAATGANLTLCSTQLAFQYDCLAMTLEQCFLAPWSVSKSRKLGADMIGPLAKILPFLR